MKAPAFPALPIASMSMALFWLSSTPAYTAPHSSARSAPRTEATSPLDGLRKLEDVKLTALQKGKLGLQLYRNAILHPSAKTGKPDPTQPAFVTQDYVLAQITRKLAETGADVPFLRQQWESANPGLVKDSLALFLALRGIATAKEPVTALLRDHTRPLRLRELAATALGELAVAQDDPSVGRVLAQVVREDVQSIPKVLHHGDTESRSRTEKREEKGENKAGSKGLSPLPSRLSPASGTVLVFPVRRAAAEAIRRMQLKGLLLESYVTAAAERAQVEMTLPKR